MIRLAAREFFAVETLCQGVRPGRLQPARRRVSAFSVFGQRNEMGAAVVRVGAQLDEVVLSHLVDDALNTLAI